MLRTLFYLFEAQLAASVITLFCVDPRAMSGIDDAAGIVLGFSFIGQLIVCFFLRRTDRRLALIGWLSLLAAFLSGLLMPAVA
jgi:hypothetical protein